LYQIRSLRGELIEIFFLTLSNFKLSESLKNNKKKKKNLMKFPVKVIIITLKSTTL
jgi:hypothetical protein